VALSSGRLRFRPPQGKSHTFRQKKPVARLRHQGAFGEKEGLRLLRDLPLTDASGPAPTVVKRVLKHYRCPNARPMAADRFRHRLSAVKIGYVLPADPTDPTKLAE
jgi:hypothetical protein